MRVLVVDDEASIADLVALALKYEGFEVAKAGTVREAKALIAEFRPELIVLDVMLPDGCGIGACERWRRDGFDAPVIFLTARHTVADRIAGLTAGGDDYLTKPFSLDELVARIRAVLRRVRPEPSTLVLGDLELDEDARRVLRGGRRVDLTPTEFALLRYLLINAGRVLTKRQILDHVWAYDFGGSDNAVHTFVSYLRRKLGEPDLIHTVPRVGYVMRVSA